MEDRQWQAEATLPHSSTTKWINRAHVTPSEFCQRESTELMWDALGPMFNETGAFPTILKLLVSKGLYSALEDSRDKPDSSLSLLHHTATELIKLHLPSEQLEDNFMTLAARIQGRSRQSHSMDRAVFKRHK